MNTKNSSSSFSLVYLSRCSAGLLAADEKQRKKALTAVQTAEGEKARQIGFNGILIVAEGYFIGWMEGDETIIRARATALARSFFHTDIQILYTGYAPTRLDRWTMALVARTGGQSSLATQIAVLESGKVPNTQGSVPASMLRSIVEPEVIRRQHSMRRIGMLGQTGIWSSALVSHLADSWGVPVVHARISSGAGFAREGIIDYLNAEHPVLGHIRLLNLAGDVSSMAWTRGIEEKMTACVLFYSVGDPDIAKVFTERCLHHLQPYGRFIPVLSLFGRAAADLAASVEDLFAAAGRDVRVDQLSLADSPAVWLTIVDSLLSGQSNATINQLWVATSLPPSPMAAPARADAQMLEFSFSEKIAPLKKPDTPTAPTALKLRAVSPAPELPTASASQNHSVTPQDAAAPALQAARLTQAGQSLLASLLEIDAVVAVGAQCGQNGSAAVRIGQQPGLSAAEAKTRELAFRTALNAETDQHASLQRMHLRDGKSNQKILTRWSQHFTLSFNVRGDDLVVVLLQMADGYNNESLVRAAVRACLDNLHEPLFERV